MHTATSTFREHSGTSRFAGFNRSTPAMDVSVLLAFGVFVVLMLASFGKHVSHMMEHEVIKNWESDAIDLERHIGFKA